MIGLDFDLNMDFATTSPHSNDYDVVIIGGGPAGASAAIYTARADLKTLVIDKGLTAGALGITSKINNYPGISDMITGAELVEKIRNQAMSFGAEFITDKVVGIDLSSDIRQVFVGTKTFQTKVIILASGAMGRSNTVPGEIEFLGQGVSYCATCDGAFFRDKEVAVVGNNDEAIEEALFLTKFVQTVHLISPTSMWKARESLLEKIGDNPKIKSYMNTRLKQVIGADGKVNEVKISPRGESDFDLPVSGVFIYLQGGKPITDFLMGQLEITEDGCLKVDREMQTSVPGVYAVGDLICTHIKQAVIASADGVISAVAADKYINGRTKSKIDWN